MELLVKINRHFSQLAPHEKGRDGVLLLNAAKDEIEMLRNLLVCITHHDNAINEYEPIWLPVVQAELARRIRDEA